MAYPITQIPSKIDNITPTDFGVQVYEFDDGTTSRRLRHIKPANTTIRLSYEGVDASFVSDLLAFYRNESEGMKNSFDLPSELFSRHPSMMIEVIDLIDGSGKWRFEKPPDIETEIVDVYDVTVDLKNTPEVR